MTQHTQKPQTFVIGANTKGVVNITDNVTNLNTLFGEANDKLSVSAAYARQAHFRRCVNLRGETVAGIPWTLRQGERVVWSSEDGAVPEEVAMLAPLREWLYLTEVSSILTASAYMHKATLTWWSPDTITPKKDAKHGLVGFWREVNGHRTYYKADEVLYVHKRSPYAEIGPGSSDADALRIHADILRNLSVFQDTYLDRGLIKATVLSVPLGTPRPEAERVERWWNKFFRGVRGVGQKVFQAGKIEATVVGEGLSDLADTAITEEQHKAIAGGLNIPYSMVESSAPNYATKLADQVDYYELTAIPSAMRIQDAWNEQLFSGFGYSFAFEPQKLRIFRRHELDTVKAITLAVGEPILSREEGRALLPASYLREESMVIDDDGEDLSAKALRELAKWKRSGKGVKWHAQHVPDPIAKIIKQRLAWGETVEEAFQPPYVGF